MSRTFHFNINIPIKFVPMEMYPEGTIINNNIELKVDDEKIKKINSELFNWLNSFGIDVEGVRYFESIPFTKYKIHSDSADRIAVKLNFVYNSYNSKMLWFDVIKTPKDSTFTNVSNESIPTYEFEDLKELYSTITDTHCLIDGGVIHQLVNSDNHGINRKCFSLKLTWLDKEKKLTWNDAVEILKDYID